MVDATTNLMMAEAEEGGPTDKAAEKAVFTSDEIIDEICRKRSWKFNIYVLCLITTWIYFPPIVYLTSFAGINPDMTEKGDKWTCLTEKCEDLASSWNQSKLHEIPCSTRENADGEVEFLLDRSDFQWNVERTSFSIDFDLYCPLGGRSGAGTLLSSIYFAGALAALVTGSMIFDNIGRKRSAMIGTVIMIPVTFIGTFCHNYYFLFAIRFMQGYSGFLMGTPMFILVQETLPTHLRNFSNCLFEVFWALGYAVVSGIGYFIHDWNYMFLAASIVALIATLPVFLCVESPRFHLMKNDAAAAKKSLKFLMSINDMDLNIDDIRIEDENKTKERTQSYLQQLKEMIQYPGLALETALQMFLWFSTAMAFYGFNFGWGVIIPDLYIGYLMAMVGELIAYTGLAALIVFIGRRASMQITFGGAAISYLVALRDLELNESGTWSVEGIACLFGVVFVSGAFSGVYLWSGELAPTSHRGLVFGASSSAARVGSFLGPFIFLNLKQVVPREVPLVGMAVLMVLCLCATFLLPDTGDNAVPLTGQDVLERRKKGTSVVC